MYPANFFQLVAPFPRNNQVFVAISFSPEFEQRWVEVIDPGIRGADLEPYRVDASAISDSIVTAILQGISESKLIFADISLTSSGERNGNVMYEVGLAHAKRLAQEVVLFRSDRKKLLFDVSTIRVNTYDPESDPEGARAMVTEVVKDALKEIELQKSLAVRKAAESLDSPSLVVLSGAAVPDGFRWPELGKSGELLSALPRLLAVGRLLAAGLIRAEYSGFDAAMTMGDLSEQAITYRATPLGSAVFDEAMERITRASPGYRSK